MDDPMRGVLCVARETADVVVIGLGAMGAAALYQRGRLGVRAIGVDRFDPPHDCGPSHSDMDRVQVVSACSGHGFKHPAALGEAVAQRVVLGVSPIDLSPFRLERYLAACGANPGHAP